MLRKNIWVKISAILLAGIIGLIAVGELMAWSFLRQPAERWISRSSERSVELGSPFALHLIGGIQLKLGAIKVSAPDEFNLPYFVDAKEVEIVLRYGDLLHLNASSPYRIKRLHAREMDANLIRTIAGHSTWDFAADKNQPSRPFPLIETLTLDHGQAVVRDALNSADLKLTFSSDEGLSAQQSISKIQTVGIYKAHPIKGEIQTHGFLPVASQLQTDHPFNSKGWVEYGKVRADFDGWISDLFGKQQIKGKLLAKGPSLAVLGDLVNVVLPTTGEFNLLGLIEKKDDIWNSHITYARVGRSDLSGEFQYDTRKQPPILTGDLHGKRFVLADLAPAFGTLNEEGDKIKPKNGRTLPDRPLGLPSLNDMDANIKVDLAFVDLGNAFSMPIAPLKADLVIAKGKLSLSNLDAQTAYGSITGLISVDAGLSNNDVSLPNNNVSPTDQHLQQIPQWKIDLGWQNINLEQWLKVSKQRQRDAKKQGDREVPPAYVTGTLNGNSALTGRGESTAKLLASLNGDVSFYIRKGTISHLIIELLGLDVAQSIGLLVSGDQSLKMECAVMSMKAKNGIVTPSLALIDTPVTMVLIDGDVNMATESLNLRLSAKPKNFSPLTLRSPIRVTGTFANPKASPEGGPIAAKVAGSVALAFLNPLAAILPMIDPGDEPSDQVEASCAKSLSALEKNHPQKGEKKVSVDKNLAGVEHIEDDLVSDAPEPSTVALPIYEGRGISPAIIATVVVVVALSLAQDFFIPLLVGILFSYTLNPLVVWFEHHGVKRTIASTIVMLAVIVGMLLTVYSVRNELKTIVEQVPEVANKLSKEIISMRSDKSANILTVQKAATAVQQATAAVAENTASTKRVTHVVVEAPSFRLDNFLWAGSLGVFGVVGQMSMVIFLIYFLLLSGDRFKRKLVKLSGPTMAKRKITVHILDDMNASIQRYMFMLLVTNFLLGILSWLVLSLFGLENAGAWGVASGLLHIVPYFGPVLTAIATGMAAFMQFNSLWMAVAIASSTLLIATFVGVFVTTWMIGRIAKINAVSVFISLMFWAWLWGVWGVLLSVPIIVIIKVISQHVEQLHPVAELLAE